MKRILCSLATVALVVAISGFVAEAAKPPPPPPPPPPNPADIYEWRPDLGGWLDTDRNLVWGYDIISLRGTSTHSGYGISHSLATAMAANYASALFEMAESTLEAAATQTEDHADWQTQQGDIALANGDPELAADWYAAAAANYAKAQADRDSIEPFLDAAAVTGQFTWRLPTQAEAQSALTNGLFTYGPTGFNGYDGSPYVGAQVPWNTLTWSSTTRKGDREAWAYQPLSGNNGFIGVGSQVNCIFVRTHVP